MIFILRAVFWVTVVAAFTPPQFHMSENSPLKGVILSALEEPGHRSIESAAEAADETRSQFCRNQAELCAVTEQLALFADFLGDVAVSSVEGWAEAQASEPANSRNS